MDQEGEKQANLSSLAAEQDDDEKELILHLTEKEFNRIAGRNRGICKENKMSKLRLEMTEMKFKKMLKNLSKKDFKDLSEEGIHEIFDKVILFVEQKERDLKVTQFLFKK